MLNFIQGMYMPCHITIQHKILTVDAMMQKHNLIYANLKWPLLQVLYRTSQYKIFYINNIVQVLKLS